MPPPTNALERHLTPQLDAGRKFFWHRLRWRAVRRYVPAGSPLRLVDMGAGAGLLGEYIARDRPQVEYRYVEPIPALEAALERRYGAAANARADETFPSVAIVTLLDVLEHQEDDRGFLAELAAKMDRGARLILTVPAMPSLWSSWDVSLGHFKRYTRATLAASLADLPFERIETSYLFPEMVPAALLRRRRAAGGDPEDGGSHDVAFPELSRPVNGVLYALGSITQSVRRGLPIGTSLFAVLQRS